MYGLKPVPFSGEPALSEVEGDLRFLKETLGQNNGPQLLLRAASFGPNS